MKLFIQIIILILFYALLAQTTYSLTPEERLLLDAVKENKAQKIEQLFQDYPELNINVQDNDLGYTPLHWAAEKNSIQAALALLNRHADVDAQDTRQDTPLHVAVEQNNLIIAALLLCKGAHVNAQGQFSETPLHRAAMHDNINAAIILLTWDANLNAQEESLETPLHIATQWQKKDMIAFLMDNMLVDISLKNDDNQTVLKLAQQEFQTNQDYKEIITLIQNKEAYRKCLRLLFLTIKFALRYNRPEVFTELIKNNKELALALREAETGNNLFHLAVLTQNNELIKRALHYLPELISIKNNGQQKPFELLQAQSFLIKYLVEPFCDRYRVINSALEISAY